MEPSTLDKLESLDILDTHPHTMSNDWRIFILPMLKEAVIQGPAICPKAQQTMVTRQKNTCHIEPPAPLAEQSAPLPAPIAPWRGTPLKSSAPLSEAPMRMSRRFCASAAKRIPCNDEMVVKQGGHRCIRMHIHC